MEKTERKNQDRWIGIVILLVGPILFYETYNFHVVDWAPLGMAFWPRLILGGLFVYALYFIFAGSLDQGPFKALDPRAYALISGGLVYVLLWESLGFLICTPLFIFLFGCSISGFRRRRMIQNGATAIIGTAVIYWVFNRLLYVQFPDGIFEVAP